ncbi:MAG: copper amine oxidase N-terminal domain-containing protein, partial [Syntrophomonas sp.]
TLPKADIPVAWNAVAGASCYAYALRDMTNNDLPIGWTQTSQRSFTIPASKLTEGHQYRLWVASTNASGTEYSVYTFFTISVSPSGTAAGTQQNPTNSGSKGNPITGDIQNPQVNSNNSQQNSNSNPITGNTQNPQTTNGSSLSNNPVTNSQSQEGSNVPRVILDGRILQFDVDPFIQDGRTLVPVGLIFMSLGAQVSWNGESRTVTATKNDTTIVLPIGDKYATKNSEQVILDVPAQICNSRTMVPLAFISLSFGADVAWEGSTRTVTITSPASSNSVQSGGSSMPF